MNAEVHNKALIDESLNELTGKIIGCAMQVSNTLGAGFLEKIYENALSHELRKAGFDVQQQAHIAVWYDGVCVGDYYPDLLVDRSVLVELKAIKDVGNVEIAQCLNYLRATGMQICLLINFGSPKLQFNRVINSHRNRR